MTDPWSYDATEAATRPDLCPVFIPAPDVPEWDGWDDGEDCE